MCSTTDPWCVAGPSIRTTCVTAHGLFTSDLYLGSGMRGFCHSHEYCLWRKVQLHVHTCLHFATFFDYGSGIPKTVLLSSIATVLAYMYKKMYM